MLKVDSTRLLYASRPDLCRVLLSGLPGKKKGFCRVCTLKPTKVGGYVQLSVAGANKFATLGEVLLWSKSVTLGLGNDFQVSHLCHEPLCLCPEHVVVETCLANNGRKGCGVVFPCGHCPKIYLTCGHEPACILFVEGFSSWEDFLLNGKHT